MKRKSNNKFNQYKTYPKAVEHALRAINEELDIKVDGQYFIYDKQQNILSIVDDFITLKYKPKFKVIGGIKYCEPFAEKIEDSLN